MTGKYILDEQGNPKSCHNVIEWADWFEKTERHVADDKIGEVRVSTVFLGIDHSFEQNGPPILFETMVFGGELNEEQDRYSTREEAIAGHAAMIERVKTEQGDKE